MNSSRQTTSTGFRPKIDQENRLDFDLSFTSESGLITSAHFNQFWRETRLPFRYWEPSQELCPRTRNAPPSPLLESPRAHI